MFFNFNFFEGANCDCAFPHCCFSGGETSNDEDDEDGVPKAIRDVATKHSITIIPYAQHIVAGGTEDTNLYPAANQVEKWNIFVVGSDKTYILAHVNDTMTPVPNIEYLANRKGTNILPPEMEEFFDAVWDKTLKNNNLKLLVAWNERLFKVSSFPLINKSKVVVGATLFMKPFNHMNYPNSSASLSSIKSKRASKIDKTT